MRAAVVLFLIFGGVLLSFSVDIQDPSSTLKQVVPKEMGDADMAFSHVSFVQMREGVRDIEFTADTAQWFDKRQTTLLKNIVIHMPSHLGVPVTLRGAQGTMDAGGKNIGIRGGEEWVAVEWGDDYRLRAASLAWSSEDRKVFTNDPVILMGRGMAVYGTGMTFSSDRSEMTLRDVHAEMG